MILAVIGYLVLVIGFYLQVLAPLMLEVLFKVLFCPIFRRKEIPQTSFLADRPDSLRARHPKIDKSKIKVSSVVGAMDGRLVQLEISFGEGFNHHRMAIAWVKKPRAGEPLPTVTFVISPPDADYGGGTCLVQVPDEQLGDFEAVENRKGVYRLTSVLYVEDEVTEEMFCE